MKTVKEMTEVMQAYDEGKKIERINKKDGYVSSVINTEWDWEEYDYRIKSERTTRPMTLEEIVVWWKNHRTEIITFHKTDYTEELYLTFITGIDIDKEDEHPICISPTWLSVEEFTTFCTKEDGSKFEVEE